MPVSDTARFEKTRRTRRLTVPPNSTIKYNRRTRLGRGFSLAELKVRFCRDGVSTPSS